MLAVLRQFAMLLMLSTIMSTQHALADESASMTKLAQQYEHAEGLPKDLGRAIRFYCEAARDGNAQAQYHLGWMYANGRGTERDEAIASYLFAQASSQGHAYAQRMLAYVQDLAPTPPPCFFNPKLTTRLSVK